MDLQKIDKNFIVEEDFGRNDIVFYPVTEAPISVHGLFHNGVQFMRMPQEAADAISENAHNLCRVTAGGRVRFRTDSPFVAIKVKMPFVAHVSQCTLVGGAGFDMYDGERYVNTFVPPYTMTDGFHALRGLPGGGVHQVTINFPVYSQVSEMYIGIKEGATLQAADPYAYTTPVVYYGSSITQGGCCSRPGNTYQAILSRRLNTEFINLGFSGSALGEPAVGEYIKTLDMSVFVYDYDRNSPSAEHLEKTHEPLFRIIRQAHPQLPVVMISRQVLQLNGEEKRRYDIIRATYENARAAGDERVFFVDGTEMFAQFGGDSCTVDGIHPNDLGFMAMANALEPVVRHCLQL